ncbi:MAG: hypothetical protein GEV28_35605 [Actinophytocola sp.]|uniref:hypothetical protein n=1 Tax=Actinophytocola sp. TaxID=1872138 RepID=UPI0013236BCD|nr:hypothetical protein [Actinophytocola sp.]MPZ85430.1 hypothetical protein [Actinophytocola sp.]
MGYESYTVDQLIEANSALNDQADGLFDRLGRITAAAAGRGVEVRVNLEGRLVALDLSPEAMALEPDELAAEIYRLTQEASATALSAGLAALEPVAGEELTAELAQVIAARPRPRPAAPVPAPAPVEREPAPVVRVRTLDDADDFSAVESWAVPR